MQTITSKDNPKLKAVRALMRSKKERQEASAFVMEGVRALLALTDGTGLPCYQLKEIWASDKAPSDIQADYRIPHDIMEQLSDCRTSQGILGVVEYTPEPLEIHPERGNYLLLDEVMDPGNMGTLIRSAVAFGFAGVFLHGDCVEVFNPKTVRATMGALPFCRFQTLENNEGADSACFQTLENLGYDLIATVLTGGENLHEMKFGPKNVLVIGNEARGVSEAIQKRATRKLSIPMSGNVESLNAAVAGSVCMCFMGREL
ncbi:MAG: RNA methyltransferase [Kiritimatiellales bacterium]|nr:RNA methyltransferase [Kiritimatiellales bacterium]